MRNARTVLCMVRNTSIRYSELGIFFADRVGGNCISIIANLLHISINKSGIGRIKQESIFYQNSCNRTNKIGILPSIPDEVNLEEKNLFHIYTKLVFNSLYSEINLITTK